MRARRGGESGGGGQAAGPGGYRVHRARGRSGRTANAITCAAPPLSCAPPPRVALSIHKFSVGSAATELQSQPGEPCICRPPSRRPWAARPGAEVGAAGPGARGRAGTGGRMRAARGWRPAPGPALAHRSCRARLREGSGAWERPAPRPPPAAWRGSPPMPVLGLSLP